MIQSRISRPLSRVIQKQRFKIILQSVTDDDFLLDELRHHREEVCRRHANERKKCVEYALVSNPKAGMEGTCTEVGQSTRGFLTKALLNGQYTHSDTNRHRNASSHHQQVKY